MLKPDTQGRQMFSLSGLLIREAFLDALPADKIAARRLLGLTPERITICLLYGGGGSWRMQELALALRQSNPAISDRIQLIFLCGHNNGLRESLVQYSWTCPVLIEGFTRDVHRYLGSADIFVGKPGPGCVSEALACGLALLLDRSTAMPQERSMLTWVRNEGLGLDFTSPRQFCDALETLCRVEAMAKLNPNRFRGPGSNQAVKQIPAVIDQILNQQ